MNVPISCTTDRGSFSYRDSPSLLCMKISKLPVFKYCILFVSLIKFKNTKYNKLVLNNKLVQVSSTCEMRVLRSWCFHHVLFAVNAHEDRSIRSFVI